MSAAAQMNASKQSTHQNQWSRILPGSLIFEGGQGRSPFCAGWALSSWDGTTGKNLITGRLPVTWSRDGVHVTLRLAEAPTGLGYCAARGSDTRKAYSERSGSGHLGDCFGRRRHTLKN